MAPLDPITGDYGAEDDANAYGAVDMSDPSGGGGTPSAPRTSAPKPAAAVPTTAAASNDGWTDVPNSIKPVQASLSASELAKEPNPIVRMLVMGDYDPALMRRFKPEEQQAILQRAQQYDPGLDLSNYPAKAQAKKAFTSGPSAVAVRQINQFIGHVNQLADAEATLNNSTFVPGVTNTVGNAVSGWFNINNAQRRQHDYNAVAQAVANEYENMIRGSSVSGIKERESTLSEVDKNQSPEAVKGWINGALGVMNSRLNELQNQYKQGTGLQYGLDVLNPKSKSILKRFGVTPEDGGGVASVAATSRPTTPTAATTAPVSATTPPAVGSSTNTAAPRKQLDAATAQQFLQQAGGNKDKARGLARAAGYDF